MCIHAVKMIRAHIEKIHYASYGQKMTTATQVEETVEKNPMYLAIQKAWAL